MKTHVITGVAVSLLLAGFLHAWERTYGGEYGECANHVEVASDGGYVVAGWTKSEGAGQADFWLFKTDSLGNVEWEETYGTDKAEYCNSLCKTSDGGYLLAGNVDPTGSGYWDAFLVKTDAAGNQIWANTYGEGLADVANSVIEARDGGYIVVGTKGSTGYTDGGFWVFKVNSDGEDVWDRDRHYGGTKFSGYGITQSVDEGYMAVGHPVALGSQLLKLDEDGNSVWSSQLSVTIPRFISVTSDGGYIIAGGGEGETSSLQLRRVDSQGNLAWGYNYPSHYVYGSAGGKSVCETSDGCYTATGCWGVTGSQDLLLLKACQVDDTTADTLWTRTFGGSGIDEGYCVQQTPDGGFIVAGWTLSFGAGSSDAWLIKTDSLGYTGVKEEPTTDGQVNWKVISSVGSQIVLRYSNSPGGFSAAVYDVSGQKVDEVHDAEPLGVVYWGQGQQAGVYFVRVEGAASHITQKVVLVR